MRVRVFGEVQVDQAGAASSDQRPKELWGGGEEKHRSDRARDPKMDQKGQGAEPHGSGFGLTVSREQSVAARLRCVSEAQRPRRLCRLCRREGSAPRPGPRHPPHRPRQRCPMLTVVSSNAKLPGFPERSRCRSEEPMASLAASAWHSVLIPARGEEEMGFGQQHGLTGGPTAPPGAQPGCTFSSKHRPGQVEALQTLGSLLKVPAEGNYPW